MVLRNCVQISSALVLWFVTPCCASRHEKRNAHRVLHKPNSELLPRGTPIRSRFSGCQSTVFLPKPPVPKAISAETPLANSLFFSSWHIFCSWSIQALLDCSIARTFNVGIVLQPACFGSIISQLSLVGVRAAGISLLEGASAPLAILVGGELRICATRSLRHPLDY